MPATSALLRKKLPKRLAVIDTDNCTGCEACIAVCPVDCIALHRFGQGVMGIDMWCEIDLDRCIGCEWCIHLPRHKGDVYQQKICPWNAIEMVATERLPDSVTRMAGLPEHLPGNGERLLAIAHRLAEQRLAAHGGPPAEPPRASPQCGAAP